MTGSLAEIANKIAARRVVSEDEARQVMASSDLVTVGMVASEARRIRVGEGVSFVRVAEVVDPAADDFTCPPLAGEVRVTGRPASLDAAIAAVRAAVAKAGATPVSAFALDALVALAPTPDALEAAARALREAGAVAVAEAPIDVLTDPAVAVARVVAGGLAVPVASWRHAQADPVAALRRLMDLQKATHAFRAFAPLPRTLVTDTPSTGYDDVKTVALARVMLDDIEHVQVDWASHGPKLAQVALLFGASDLDRVSPLDDAPLGHRRAPLEEVRRNINAAFLTPSERDGRFQKVVR